MKQELWNKFEQMDKNEFDFLLKKALKEKAPDGFTDNLMEKLIVEQQSQQTISASGMPGKGFVFILLGLTVLAILSILHFGANANPDGMITGYMDRLISKSHFQIAPSLKIMVFSIGALSAFLLGDYFVKSRKMLPF